MKEFQVLLRFVISSVLSLDVSKQQIFEEIPNNEELTAWNEDFSPNDHQLPPRAFLNSIVKLVLVPLDEGRQYSVYSPPGIAINPYGGNQFPTGNVISLQPPATDQGSLNQLINRGIPPQVDPYKGVQVNYEGLTSSGVKGALVDKALPTGRNPIVKQVGYLGHVGRQAVPVVHTGHVGTNIAKSVSALSAPFAQIAQVRNVNNIKGSLNQLINRGIPPQVDPYKGVQVKGALVDKALPIGINPIVKQFGYLGHVGRQAVPVVHTGHVGTNIAQSVSALSAPFAQIAQVGNVDKIKVPFRCPSTFWSTKDCNTCYCNSGHPVCIPILCEKQSCPMKRECVNVKGFCVKSGTKCHGKLAPSLCVGDTCTCCIPQAGIFALP